MRVYIFVLLLCFGGTLCAAQQSTAVSASDRCGLSDESWTKLHGKSMTYHFQESMSVVFGPLAFFAAAYGFSARGKPDPSDEARYKQYVMQNTIWLSLYAFGRFLVVLSPEEFRVTDNWMLSDLILTSLSVFVGMGWIAGLILAGKGDESEDETSQQCCCFRIDIISIVRFLLQALAIGAFCVDVELRRGLYVSVFGYLGVGLLVVLFLLGFMRCCDVCEFMATKASRVDSPYNEDTNTVHGHTAFLGSLFALFVSFLGAVCMAVVFATRPCQEFVVW